MSRTVGRAVLAWCAVTGAATCSFDSSGDKPRDGGRDGAVVGDALTDRRTDLPAPDLASWDGGVQPQAPMYAELWYSSGDRLVYVQLNAADGTVTQIVPSTVTGMEIGQNSITMLADGSLLLLRQVSGGSEFYHVAEPPRDGSPVTPRDVGPMRDGIMIEALYTDCIGRLYGMDTGADVSSSEGNRLLLFTGDYLEGDFTYKVVTDLSKASTADIDDMSPGISSTGIITDNPGFAIDTGDVYDFNYQTGTGTKVGQGGKWGIHALGGSLFSDGKSRLYIMSEKAQIFEMNPATNTLSAVLATGPDVNGDQPGHSGLAGPLTNCQTGFIIE